MRSRMIRKCHVRFWRRVSEVTHWLSLMNSTARQASSERAWLEVTLRRVGTKLP
ncbi:hypothetical protein [Moorena sp. SIO4G3]|uniref:hypothetical protein n=1 Tax=Moorena sp. SIO4G3 TaxID=2607821 RepID=UPI00142A8A96|nr:hypothetical protein [Moorena sp. SIO4G3]NEO79853.1 hypothetical protein [Moorena sp. SIO4G3]